MADFLLPVGPVGTGNAAYRMDRRRRVQRRKNEMSRFSRRQGRIHRFPIAHLPDEDDIRILPQGLPDAFLKGRKMAAQFALGNECFVPSFHVFNRVFQGDDMAPAPLIDAV